VNIIKNNNGNQIIPWKHPQKIKAIKCGIIIAILILLLVIDMAFSNGNKNGKFKDEDEVNFTNYLKRHEKVYIDPKERQNRKISFI